MNGMMRHHSLQGQSNKVARDVARKHQFTQEFFLSKFRSVFPFVIHELTDLLTQLKKSFQYLSLAAPLCDRASHHALNLTPLETFSTDGDLNVWLNWSLYMNLTARVIVPITRRGHRGGWMGCIPPTRPKEVLIWHLISFKIIAKILLYCTLLAKDAKI